MLGGIQDLLPVLEVTIMVHVHEHSWVIDRYQRHLNDVGERVVISKLGEVRAGVNECINTRHRIRIGLEKVPIDSLSSSGCTKDIWFSVLDDEMDEREGPEAFFSVEVSRMKWEEGEGIDIRTDPRFPRMDGAVFFVVFSWWSWNKVW
jgi:hypothetical protein